MNLRTLELSGDFTDEGLTALRGLVRLESLSLMLAEDPATQRPMGRCTGRGLADLSGLPRLTKLWTDASLDAAGLDAVGSLRHLEELSIVLRADAGDLHPLARLDHLRSLELSGAIDGNEFQPLGGLPLLSRLNLSMCRLVGDPAVATLARLPALETLDLGWSRVTAAGAAGFAAAPCLKELSLPPLPPGELAQLRGVLPNCRVNIVIP